MLFLCIGQVLFAIYEIWMGSAFTITVAMLLVIQTLGLYRRLRWGHRLSTFFLWFLMVIGIGLMLPARFEGVDMMGEAPPSMLVAGMQALAVCGTALISLHVLGKHKSLFRPDWF